MQADLVASNKKYEEDIRRWLDSFNQCKGNLESVTAQKALIEINVENLNIHITEIQKNLNITITSVNEANSNMKKCENTSNGQKDLIEQLRGTITDRITELTQCKAEKSKCDSNLKDSDSTVATQNKKITDIESSNNKLTGEGAQCKRDLAASQEGENSCIASKNVLTDKIKDYTDQLSSCRSENSKCSSQVASQKGNIAELQKSLDDCDEIKKQLIESLNIKIGDYQNDELKLHQEVELYLATQVSLAKCNELKTKTEALLQLEQSTVVECNKKVDSIHVDWDVSNKKYDQEIKRLTDSGNQCKDSIKSLGDEKLKIEINVQNLNAQITEFKSKTEINLKIVEEANSKTKQCEDSSNELNRLNVELERTIKDKSTDLTKCTQQSTSLQTDLKECGSNNDKCNSDLKSSKSKIVSLEETIETDENTIKKLTQESSQCKNDLECSRKESDSCRTTNNNLTDDIKKTSEKLNGCQGESHDLSLQIISLKSAIDEVKKSLGCCDNDKAHLTEQLNIEIGDYTEDQRKLVEEIALMKVVQTRLDSCNATNTDLTGSYQSEKKLNEDLTLRLEKLRIECVESTKKLDEQIQSLTGNFNQCKVNLNTETNSVNNLTIEVEDISKKLENSKKAADAANANTQRCETDKQGVQIDLSKLRCTVDSYLKQLKDAETKAYESFNDGVTKFVGINEITCKA